MITQTGAYEISNAEYHGDCCTRPSISATGMKQIIADPSEYWRFSPMNPEREARHSKRAFDIGTVLHSLVLEPETVKRTVAVIPEDALGAGGGITTKAAREFRDHHEAAGRVVLKPDDWASLCDMADSIMSHDVAARALEGGAIEQSYIVYDEARGVFIKSRPDCAPRKDGRFIVDLKTAARSDIYAWERQSIVDYKYHIQAAVMMRNLREAAGIEAAGVMYVVVCKDPPYRVAIRTIRPDSEVGSLLLESGWFDAEKALDTFAECLAVGKWPSPWDTIKDIEPPEWALAKMRQRLETGE